MKLNSFVKRHRYRDGRTSVWISDYFDAMRAWESIRNTSTDACLLIEPCLSGPLKTSPSIWRIDYIGPKRNAETIDNVFDTEEFS